MTLRAGLKRHAVRALAALRRDAPGGVVVRTDAGFTKALWASALDRSCPGWRESIAVRFCSGRLDFLASLPAAAVCSTFALDDDLFVLGRRLRWVNSVFAGIDLQRVPVPPPQVAVTTSRGIAAPAAARHALKLMALASGSPPEERLAGKIVAIVGLGAIGGEIATLCKPLRMHVIALRRAPSPPPPGCDEVRTLDELEAVLPRADFLVLAAQLSDRTDRLIGSRELALMQPSAVIVNVARGQMIDEAALAAALRSSRLGGAGLDVLSVEPPPADHALHGCPNLVITPHVAGNVYDFKEEIAARFGRNLRAFLDGRPLEGAIPADYWRP